MRYALIAIAIIIVPILAQADYVITEDLKTTLRETQFHGSWEKTLKIGEGVEIPASVEVTSKGNGSLKVANLRMKVIDNHDDIHYFENGVMNVHFTDINKDGFLDLVASGIVVTTDEKGDHILSRSMAVVIFLYNAEKQGFVQVFHDVPENINFLLEIE